MDLGHLFIDTVTYSTALTYSDGDFAASTKTTAIGRWEENYEVVTMSGGEERTSTHRFATTTAIPVNALVWGPGATTTDQSHALRVLKRKFAKTLDGAYSYYIISLGA